MLTEAWKPPKPQGWPVGPDLRRDEHVPRNPSEMHAGGGEAGGLAWNSSKSPGGQQGTMPSLGPGQSGPSQEA